ncbi:DUF4091 domain-containing protein [Paenibacillus sp. MWE-103]|uniref:DUF4091 domain-containing protein n=1 Tax=Paenibacillus artemisiicola TaxID=1172618 RepID=A0ABS3WEB2_9BACL|nr:DUF4091 domain-containing protein [Paenibacillus artemisiicola]MBO7746671.1 DUF4091 domain-containing protein [Paenibacillus artemisiicola]
MTANAPAFEWRCLSPLAKVFPDEEPAAAREEGSALIGEHVSFQVAYRSAALLRRIRVDVETALPGTVSVRAVGLVPSELPNYADHDGYVLRTAPGLYPDPLYPLGADGVHAPPGQWRAVWVTVRPEGAGAAGVHPIRVRFADEAGLPLGEACFRLAVHGAELPEQELLHTEWFYADCLATQYKTAMFSEAHWALIEAYARFYAEHGMNMILTPLFSPPLELDPGRERPTVQLVGVRRDGERYAFDFARLARWVDVCRSAGVAHFEFAHLFTQWGAKHAPKIMAGTEGGEERIFGWESDADGPAYRAFLAQFVPELLAFVRGQGLEERVWFHVSDEPWIGDMPHYERASKLLRSLIGDYPVLDALSDYRFYDEGLLSHPVVSTEHIDVFLERGADNLWAYYCCCEYKHGESNRFMAMPSERTRIIGAQLYKFGLQGFLHWGFNHWYSQRSRKAIDPYACTDADLGFPSGDAFLVYPGADGPVGSVRLELLRSAMQDARALRLLERLSGREAAIRCLEEDAEEPLTFRQYPRDPAWLLGMRERVNRRIAEAAAGDCIH